MAVRLNSLRTLDELIEEARKTSGLIELEQKRATLKSEIDQLVIEAGEEYEDESIRIVRVQGFRRSWDVDKLEKIIPRPIFRRIVKVDVDAEKLDDEVRAGNLKLTRQVKAALTETPNKAYAKWTPKSQKDGEAEADALAAKLG